MSLPDIALLILLTLIEVNYGINDPCRRAYGRGQESPLSRSQQPWTLRIANFRLPLQNCHTNLQVSYLAFYKYISTYDIFTYH